MKFSGGPSGKWLKKADENPAQNRRKRQRKMDIEKQALWPEKGIEKPGEIWTVSRAFIRGLWIALSGWIRIETSQKKV